MVIDGRSIAQQILDTLKNRVEILKKDHAITPTLAVIRVGDDQTTTSYINQKARTGEKIGVQVDIYQYPEAVLQKEILAKIQTLDAAPKIHGIILQLPIPQQLDTESLIDEISPEKDVDGFHSHTKFETPIAASVMELLESVFSSFDIVQRKTFADWLSTQHIVVIGKGKTGGKPMSDDLQNRYHVTPTIIDSTTQDPETITKNADIIISAVGKRNILEKDMIKPGAIVISIGMNKDDQGKFYGDYNEEEIKDIAGWYTPIPGGVGPVTVAKLMENVIQSAENTLQ